MGFSRQKYCTLTLLHFLCWEKRGAVGASVRGERIREPTYGFSRLCLFLTWLCILKILVSVQPEARLISLHFVLLCFTLLHFALNAFFKSKWKVCSQPVSNKSTGAFLPIALAHFVSLCHILVILQRLKKFHYYICYGDLWSMVFDVTVVFFWGCQKPCPQKTANLTNNCCVCSDCSTSCCSSLSLPLCRPLYSMRHNSIEIRPIITPQQPLNLQVQGSGVHISSF